MASREQEIDAVLLGHESIPRDKVIAWIEEAADLPSLSRLYRLTDEGYTRIVPELGQQPTCDLIQRYLLECIRQNVEGSDEIESRWEAARTLHAWFCHLVQSEANAEVLKKATHGVTELFLAGGEEVRLAVEQGFLEHALEMEPLRPYFEHWSSDERLRAAWGRALEWGLAHPDWMWGLSQQLRKRK